jgi:hypothetical protein
VEAIAHREMRWIEQYAKPKILSVPLSTSSSQKSPGAHIDLLQKYLSVAAKLLPTEDDLLLPTLWHRDLHRGNVFVHEGEVSSVIDWQSVWVGPRILRARAPQLVDYSGEVKTKLPENFKELDPEEKDRVRETVRRSILLYIYETSTAKRNPSLYRVMRYPNSKTLDELVEFASDSWDGDILPLREILIRIERFASISLSNCKISNSILGIGISLTRNRLAPIISPKKKSPNIEVMVRDSTKPPTFGIISRVVFIEPAIRRSKISKTLLCISRSCGRPHWRLWMGRNARVLSYRRDGYSIIRAWINKMRIAIASILVHVGLAFDFLVLQFRSRYQWLFDLIPPALSALDFVKRLS